MVIFSAERVTAGLDTKVIGREVQVFETLGSTNDHLMELARSGADEGVVVTADGQAKGRGRFDRDWISPPGCNLYFSILLRPQLVQAALPQITLMAAVSLCETLRETTDLPVLIKWPNDLWIGEKKVCGILTEMTSRGGKTDAVILGVGLNVNMEEGSSSAELREIVTSLSCEGGRILDRLLLLQRILNALDRDYRRFLQKGFAPFRGRFEEYSLTLGKRIGVVVSGRRMEGEAVGIDREGLLKFLTEGGQVVRISSGEISFPLR